MVYCHSAIPFFIIFHQPIKFFKTVFFYCLLIFFALFNVISTFIFPTNLLDSIKIFSFFF